jgi:hypothetical protein
MKVLMPKNESHTIKLHPRFYPSGVLNCKFSKDGAHTFTDLIPTYSVLNGVMNLAFELKGAEGDKYTLKLTENEKIVYRCRLFFTSQKPQDYKTTNQKYIYAG